MKLKELPVLLSLALLGACMGNPTILNPSVDLNTKTANTEAMPWDEDYWQHDCMQINELQAPLTPGAINGGDVNVIAGICLIYSDFNNNSFTGWWYKNCTFFNPGEHVPLATNRTREWTLDNCDENPVNS